MYWGCFGHAREFDFLAYYANVKIGQEFASSRTGEVYTKNEESLYYEDFLPKDIVYVYRSDFRPQ